MSEILTHLFHGYLAFINFMKQVGIPKKVSFFIKKNNFDINSIVSSNAIWCEKTLR